MVSRSVSEAQSFRCTSRSVKPSASAPALEALAEQLRRGPVAVEEHVVDPPGVALQVAAQARARTRASSRTDPFPWSSAWEIRAREGHEAAVLGEVGLDRGRQLGREQPGFQPGTPRDEAFLCRRVEADERDAGADRGGGAERRRVEAVQGGEGLIRLGSRARVGRHVHVLPGRAGVGPDEELEALQQPVVADAAAADGAEVGEQGAGLDAADDGRMACSISTVPRPMRSEV